MTEALWEIPASWSWHAISEIGQVISGGTPSTKDSSFWGDDVIWFSPADLTGYRSKYIGRGAKSLSLEGLKNSSARLIPAGSVMFSSRAPIGYVAINSEEATTNQGFKTVVPSEAIFNEYLYFYLKAARHVAEERATGTTFKEISGSKFATMPVPLPPLPEQKRIVAKVEELFSELDAGEENLIRARGLLGLYRQSLLKAAFQGDLTADWREANKDKLEPPETLLARIRQERNAAQTSVPVPAAYSPDESEAAAGWAWVSLDEVTASNLIGLVRSNAEQNTEGRGTNYIKMDRIDMAGRVSSSAEVFVETSEAELTRYGLAEGDILFNTRNSLELVGKTGLVRSTPPVATVFNNNLMRIRPIASVLPGFLALQMCGHAFRRRMERIKKATTSVAAVYGKDLWPLPVVVPTLAEQAEIIQILEAQLSAIDATEAEITTALAKIAALRQSILKEAFSGRLVPQDPKDEPAAALLARLKPNPAPARSRKPRT